MKTNLRRASLLAATVLVTAAAHELDENRATLVLRDRTHVSLTLYIGYTEALHRALAPESPLAEFVLVYSALAPADFEEQLKRAQARFQAGTRLVLESGAEVRLSNWAWPEAKDVQTLLRKRAMRSLVDSGGHAHEAPVEIRADAVAGEGINAVRVQFPAEYQKVLVVAFRPSQTWTEGARLSAAILF